MTEDAAVAAQVAEKETIPFHATYRVQLTPEMTFERVREQLDYLRLLGISTLYLSPPFEASKGSTHGYDGIDPTKIREELGGEEGLRRLSEEAEKRGMSVMVDWVPNHLATVPTNRFLEDVYMWGKESVYAKYFLINWEKEGANGKLVTPFLGAQIGELVFNPGSDGTYQLKLHFDEETGKLLIQCYNDKFYPLSPDSYQDLLDEDPDGKGNIFGTVDSHKYSLVANASYLKNKENPVHERRGAAERLYGQNKELYSNNPEFQERMNALLKFYNSEQGREKFLDLHDRQNFRLMEWHSGDTGAVNYKRFFNIKDLITLRQEDPEVFRETHETLLSLIKAGVIQGLRIDHIDGLADPKGYLEMLREDIGKCFPDNPERAKDFPIVVEKILEGDEKLKASWKADGTTGYDALNNVQGLFLDEKAKDSLTQTYQTFTGDRGSFHEKSSAAKKEVVEQFLCSEIDELAVLAKKIANHSPMTRDFNVQALEAAIKLIVCEFDVYRTYADRDGVLDEEDRSRVEGALDRAREKLRGHASSDINAIDFIGNILLGNPPSEKNHVRNPEQAAKDKADLRWAVQRLCAPLRAIAMENMGYYRSSRLRSLNEVGGDPGKFGTSVKEFHAFNAWQAEHHPRTLVTLQTHDTKLGPLTRAIISAISHVPGEYKRLVNGWKNNNEPFKTNGAPSAHDELMIYQTIIGALPIEINDNEDDRIDAFRERMKAFTIKAIKEGKENTNWINSNTEYEAACNNFIDHLLEKSNENTFILELIRFRKRILPVALQADLAQTVLQIGGPGVVDIYQGVEQYLHRQAMVDPDNRRPVDFKESADKIRQWEQISPNPVELAKTPRSGDFFLYTLWQTLKARADNPALFMKGTYEGLTEGKHLETRNGSTVVAFKRTLGDDSAIVVSPVLKGEDAATFGQGASLRNIFNERAALKVEGIEEGAEYKDATTGKTYKIEGGALPLARLFDDSVTGAVILTRVKKAQDIGGPKVSGPGEETETAPPAPRAPAMA